MMEFLTAALFGFGFVIAAFCLYVQWQYITNKISMSLWLKFSLKSIILLIAASGALYLLLVVQLVII